jgi:tRNA pseudouridine38-40 synthase
MARYQVTLAYDGAGFSGFQKQAETRTVQAEVEAGLRRLSWSGQSILAAGRTDTGVHATGQVIAFDLDWQHSADELLRALNSNLPEDVAAQEVRVANPLFHPRYDARSRWYRYHLFCHPNRHPVRERYAWRVWPEVSRERLHKAAAYLPGTHDFRAFGSPPRPGGTTVRTVFQSRWLVDRGIGGLDGLVFEIAADSFLYHMVRRLAALQIEVGQGRQEPEAVAHFLEGNRDEVQGLAPAHGLFLSEVRYELEKENACDTCE